MKALFYFYSKQIHLNRFFFTAATCWFILITVLLTLPGSAFPKEDWLDKIWFDKWVHIFLFGVLSFCWSAAFEKYSWKKIRYFLLISCLCLLYGIAMEFIQKFFVANRSFDLGDIVADAVGSFLGLFFAVRVYIKK